VCISVPIFFLQVSNTTLWRSIIRWQCNNTQGLSIVFFVDFCEKGNPQCRLIELPEASKFLKISSLMSQVKIENRIQIFSIAPVQNPFFLPYVIKGDMDFGKLP